MQGKKLSAVSIVLYVFAVLSFAGFVYTEYYMYTQINNAVIAGQYTVAGNFMQTFNYYLQYTSYLIWAVLLLGAGYIVQRLAPARESAVPESAKLTEGAVDEEEYEDFSTLGNPETADSVEPAGKSADAEGEEEDK